MIKAKTNKKWEERPSVWEAKAEGTQTYTNIYIQSPLNTHSTHKGARQNKGPRKMSTS